MTRKDDSSGNVSFAGANYRVGRAHLRRQVQVAIVGDTVEISAGGEVLKVHPIRHDRSCAWIAVIATVLTMSRTSAPRERSLTGLRRPCRTGPTASAPADRWTAL